MATRRFARQPNPRKPLLFDARGGTMYLSSILKVRTSKLGYGAATMGGESILRKAFTLICLYLVLCLFPAMQTLARDQSTAGGDSLKTIFQTGHTSWTQGIRFRDDGRVFASLDESGAVKVWRSSDGRILASWKMDLKLHGNNYIWDRFWFNKQGNLVFNSLKDGQWKSTVYQTFSGRLIDTRSSPLVDRVDVDVSQDGRLIVFQKDSQAAPGASLELFQTSDRRLIASFTIPRGKPYIVEVSPTGRFLAASTKNPDMDSMPGEMYIWRTSDQQAFGPFPINENLLGISDQGLAVTCVENKIILRKINDWSVAREFEIPAWPNFAAFSPDGRHLVAMSRFDLVWRLWNLEDDSKSLTSESFSEQADFVPDAVFSPDNSYIVLKGPASQGSGGFLYSPALGLWKLADYKGGPITDAGRRIKRTRAFPWPETCCLSWRSWTAHDPKSDPEPTCGIYETASCCGVGVPEENARPRH